MVVSSLSFHFLSGISDWILEKLIIQKCNVCRQKKKKSKIKYTHTHTYRNIHTHKKSLFFLTKGSVSKNRKI